MTRTLSIAVDDVERVAPESSACWSQAGADVVSVMADEAPLEEVYLRLLDGRRA